MLRFASKVFCFIFGNSALSYFGLFFRSFLLHFFIVYTNTCLYLNARTKYILCYLHIYILWYRLYFFFYEAFLYSYLECIVCDVAFSCNSYYLVLLPYMGFIFSSTVFFQTFRAFYTLYFLIPNIRTFCIFSFSPLYFTQTLLGYFLGYPPIF